MNPKKKIVNGKIGDTVARNVRCWNLIGYFLKRNLYFRFQKASFHLFLSPTSSCKCSRRIASFIRKIELSNSPQYSVSNFP